jgi:hypothetical protein
MRMVSVPGQHALRPGLHQALTVVRAAHYPWQLMVEENSAHIVEMAVEGEQASTCLV